MISEYSIDRKIPAPARIKRSDGVSALSGLPLYLGKDVAAHSHDDQKHRGIDRRTPEKILRNLGQNLFPHASYNV